MSSLESLARQIEAKLAAASREPHWQQDQIAELMTRLAPRRERFDELAQVVAERIIRPRLQTLANYFSNAKLDRGDQPRQCTCWFGYCERFPAHTKVQFLIEHDEDIQELVVRYELTMLPVFLKFDGHDKLGVPLENVDEHVVADWIAAKVLDFLDVYLRIDRGGSDFEAEVAIDPVCGMRISAASAVAKTDYRGHPYVFCSEDCQQRFAADPTRYVRFEMP